MQGGTFSYSDDKAKVLDVLWTMVNHKAADYVTKGDVTLARLLMCFAPMMTGAVDRTPSAGEAADGETAVDGLKKRLLWRDEVTEAAWVAATGWNLLTMAAMLDDLGAVRELCARDDSLALLSSRGKGIVAREGKGGKKHAHRKLPFERMLLMMAKGHTPLMGAMGYASRAVVTTMLEAGCPLPKDAMGQFDVVCGSPCMRPTGAMLNGRIDNLDAFLAVHPTGALRATAA